MNTLDLKEIQENAINLFNSGYNCAQSVLISFIDLLKTDHENAKNVASGFGAGMGRLQGTCGAITGAYMVFGLYDNSKNNDTTEKNETTYQLIQQFDKEFKKLNGTTECRLLLNCDLNTKRGKEKFKKQELKKSVCEKCIVDSINLTFNKIARNKHQHLTRGHKTLRG